MKSGQMSSAKNLRGFENLEGFAEDTRLFAYKFLFSAA